MYHKANDQLLFVKWNSKIDFDAQRQAMYACPPGQPLAGVDVGGNPLPCAEMRKSAP